MQNGSPSAPGRPHALRLTYPPASAVIFSEEQGGEQGLGVRHTIELGAEPRIESRACGRDVK
jgi:hypothetical protein